MDSGATSPSANHRVPGRACRRGACVAGRSSPRHFAAAGINVHANPPRLHVNMLPLTREKDVSSSVTHFEIYAEKPPQLAEFYQSLLVWRIEQATVIDYWRIQSGAHTAGSVTVEA